MNLPHKEEISSALYVLNHGEVHDFDHGITVECFRALTTRWWLITLPTDEDETTWESNIINATDIIAEEMQRVQKAPDG
jgi:hypothetical protein